MSDTTRATTINDAFLTVREFYTSRKVGKTFTFAEIKAGRLHVVKAGRRTLVPVASALAWDQSLSPKPMVNAVACNDFHTEQ